MKARKRKSRSFDLLGLELSSLVWGEVSLFLLQAQILVVVKQMIYRWRLSHEFAPEWVYRVTH